MGSVLIKPQCGSLLFYSNTIQDSQPLQLAHLSRPFIIFHPELYVQRLKEQEVKSTAQ